MRIKALFRFTTKIHFRSEKGDYVQCMCINLITKEHNWIGFSKASPLFNKVHNLGCKGAKEFTKYVSFDNISRDRLTVITGEEFDEFMNENAEYLI